MALTVLRKNVIYGIGSAGNSLALTLLVPYLVRTLPRDAFGAWALSEIGIVLVSSVMVLGMDVGLMREYWYANETEERRRLTGTVLAAQIGWSVILLTSCWYFIERPGADRWLASKLQMASASRWAGLVLSISLLEGLFTLLLTLFRIREKAATFVCLSVGRVLMVVLFAMAGVRIAGGVNGALQGRLTALAISVTVAAAVAHRDIAVRFNWTALKRVLGYGLPLLPTGLAGYVLLASDRYFLQALQGLEAVAVYTFAYKVATLVDLMVTRPFALDWAPRRFKIASEAGAEEKFASALVGYLFCATACGSAVIMVTPYVYRLFAPFGYAEGMTVVPVLVLGYILYGLSYPLNVGIMLRNRTSVLPLIGGVAAGACIVLNVLLIPRYGMAGAAWATCGAYCVWTGTIAMVSLKHFPLKYPVVAISIIAAGGVVGSLGRVTLGRSVTDENLLKGLLASCGWVLVVFCITGYLLWGRRPGNAVERTSDGER